jgi:hypothetical protein
MRRTATSETARLQLTGSRLPGLIKEPAETPFGFAQDKPAVRGFDWTDRAGWILELLRNLWS